MLYAYTPQGETLEKSRIHHPNDLHTEIRWLDMVDPTPVERKWVQDAYGVELLFVEEVSEIEASARFYEDSFGLHLHLYFLLGEGISLKLSSVAFTLHQQRLFTLHAEEIPEFRHYAQHNREHPDLPDDAMSIMLGIVEMRTALLADTMERLHTALETLSTAIFREEDRDMMRVLLTLAQIEDANGKARLGMLDNQRVLHGLQRTGKIENGAGMVLADILADMDSLMTHSSFLFEKAKFLIDAAMGMINLGHNRRLNIFTVLSVVLMPPTVIASIFGMNFKHMPELQWEWGYPTALLLMVLVAVVPIVVLKRKGWL